MSTRAAINLIINADDYGYFPCVSQGIVDAASVGSITATGIIANCAKLAQQLDKLNAAENLDLGVHLNLTSGTPITSALQTKLTPYGGQFPGLAKILLLLVVGKISLPDIRAEWCAQIECCQSRNLVFLNSHEHIHMFPSLFKLSIELAQQYAIPHVRLTRADWSFPLSVKACIRNALIQIMYSINSLRFSLQAPLFIGLGQSGKLDYAYLQKVLAGLKPGNTYELMCHPGHFNPAEIADPLLQNYHDWQGEFNLLTSPELLALYQQLGIRLCRYANSTNL